MTHDALDARVVELETRIAFLEGALAEMSDALAQARIESARGEALMRRVLDELKVARAGGGAADPADEPPPPHY